jgi:thioredoxin 1
MIEQNNLFTVSDKDFAERVLSSTVPIIVDFTAEWCPPCKALAPVYHKLSQEYIGKLRFARMDTDDDPEASIQLGIQGVPTLVIFKDGKELGRLVGPHPARLKPSIDRILAENGIAV